MEMIPNPTEGPDDPTPVPGEDVREPPLPSDRKQEKLPGNDELRDPDEGGGKIKKRL
jgi:hypothetical protein